MAESELDKDPEVVLRAVSNRGNAVQFADASLRDNREIVYRTLGDSLLDDEDVFQLRCLTQVGLIPLFIKRR